MKKKLICLITLLSFFSTAPMLHAAGTDQKQLSCDDFYKVRFYEGFEIVYTTGSQPEGTVYLTGDPVLLEKVIVENNQGELLLKIKGYEYSQGKVKVKLSSSALVQVRNDSDNSILTAEGPLKGTELEVKVTGNGKIALSGLDYGIVNASIVTGEGNIALSGICRVAQLSITGSGEIWGHELRARDVKCSLTGNGNIGCYAEQKLQVKSTGNGVVYYMGSPEITKRAIGKGEVKPLQLSK